MKIIVKLEYSYLYCIHKKAENRMQLVSLSLLARQTALVMPKIDKFGGFRRLLSGNALKSLLVTGGYVTGIAVSLTVHQRNPPNIFGPYVGLKMAKFLKKNHQN